MSQAWQNPALSLVESAGEHPPRARLVFRVGAVGRRIDPFPTGLDVVVAQSLQWISGAVLKFHAKQSGCGSKPYVCCTPELRVVSSLSGLDQLVAEKAVRMGYQLQCVLPFERSAYAADIKVATLSGKLQNFLDGQVGGKEPVCFEMDGRSSLPSRAYETAGHVVINQSDLLIAIWDGSADDPSLPHSRTFQAMRDALSFSIPVLWVDERNVGQVQLLSEISELPDPAMSAVPAASMPLTDVEKSLMGAVTRLIATPEQNGADGKGQEEEEEQLIPVTREGYFRETQPEVNHWLWWKIFRNLMAKEFEAAGKMFRELNETVQDFVQSVTEDWPGAMRNRRVRGYAIGGWIDSLIRKHYAWSDKLADYYADHYRSSFLWTYFLSAVAVALAAFPLAVKIAHMGVAGELPGTAESVALEIAFVLCELGCLIGILELVGQNQKKQWHLRWVEYRLIAELFRQLRFLAPMGGARPYYRITPEKGPESDANPADTWMLWHVRAVERELGLPIIDGRKRTVVNEQYVREYLMFYMRRLSSDQLKFHRTTLRRCKIIEKGLRKLGGWLFGLTIAAVVIHGSSMAFGPITHTQEWVETFGPMFAFIATVCPAFASAAYAVRVQGEFHELAQRSKGMLAFLEEANGKLEKLFFATSISSGEVMDIVHQVAKTMVDESLGWRKLFRQKELEAA